MKRVHVAAVGAIITVLIVATGGPSTAAERRYTRSVRYVTWDEYNLFIGAASGPAPPAVFAVPSWTRTVGVTVRDDSGLPVAYKVRFNAPGWANDGTPSSCGARTNSFPVPTTGTKRVFVQTESPFGCPRPSLPTRGVIKVTMSSDTV